FGFFCDMEKLKKLGILAPVSWESLGSPQFFGHLTSADPTTSSSSYMTYDLILQNLKWDTGWETIFSLGANVRGDFLHSSKKVLGHVHEDPQVACGVVIDYLFFLQREEFKPAEQKRYRYFLPKETGLFTADPVAIVARAKNKEMAVRFIDYLLSEGQHLLIKRKGHPLGPVDRGLHRLPVLRTLYSKDPGNEFYVNPFDLVSGVTFDPKVSAEKKALFSLLLKKGIVDNHDNLVKCARRAIDKKLVEKALFRKVLPVTEKQFYVKVKELKTSNKLLWDRLQYVWNKHFHDAYNALYRK
ncbi:ABC transporter substrate-binding protein, partial [Myxococcota bacterium]|nr:ABC transporter substrate-binding protein [Myxococcota bacterium]MBU1537699.1 ABC transporter substrate-binding protein [Myxococcota bacterium]